MTNVNLAPDELWAFRWSAFRGHYRWVTAVSRPAQTPGGLTDESRREWLAQHERRGPAPILTTHPLPPGGLNAVRYSPLETQPGLFRTFADTEASLDGIAAFANEYGFLGGWATVYFESTDPKTERRLVGVGESRTEWQNQIDDMRQAVELWDLARERDASGLAGYVTWNGPDEVVFKDPRCVTSVVIASRTHRPQVFERLVPDDLTQPALYRLQEIVNTRLRHFVAPKLLWNPDHSALALRAVPRHLLDALWLQLAQAITGNKRYHRCPCGKWLEISLHPTTGYRRNRLFCSDACRSKAYRDRQAKARDLHQQGLKPATIARRLKSTLPTVRTWLGLPATEVT